jgi:crossover junction endodeoxyribonuclease RuvC
MTSVVGLDLSLTSTGVAVVHPDGTVDTHRVRSAGHAGDTLDQRHARLCGISQKVWELTPAGALLAIEGPAFGMRAQAGTHDRAGLWWQIVGMMRAVGHLVVEIPPACRSKYATGKGNAAKDQVLAAAVKRYPTVDITGNDVADAVILAAMARRWLDAPIDSLPQAHLSAVGSVKWPATRPPAPRSTTNSVVNGSPVTPAGTDLLRPPYVDEPLFAAEAAK